MEQSENTQNESAETRTYEPQGAAEAAMEQSRMREKAARKTRKGKTLRAAVLIGVILVLCVGLGIANGMVAQNSSEESSAAVASGQQATQSGASGSQRGGANNATKTVTDSEGRTVEIPAEPQSIATMDSFAGELLVMSGAGSSLCGVPGGVVSDKILQQIYPALATDPLLLSGNSVNIESLMERSCDVAIVRGSLDDAERDKLDRVGIPYVVVDYTTMEEQIAAMRLIAGVLEGESGQKADSIAQYYEDVLTDVRARTERIPQSERLRVYHSINAPLLTDGVGSLGADWVSAAGCVDVSAGEAPTSGSDYIATLEQIYVWDPDVVICNVASTAKTFTDTAQWEGLRAVAAERIYNIPVGATRWGQRGDVETWFALLWLGCTVYPEHYSDVDLKQKVVGFYRDYLGVEVDDALYSQILSGEGVRSEGTGDGTGTGGGGGGGR